ncbi:hypothetical protein [Pedobacter flavus]|uniref:DUF4252 domain-containing protein n=1 Tax=Pedobacter flavus TaxID=3113906 RepID=A0ABU7H187_9SPHI|nr:hypothetical protein [Pedobacter sp. VNH31]MEE1885072.1 hypothetical protein [Pedobacter sp. VNH31]
MKNKTLRLKNCAILSVFVVFMSFTYPFKVNDQMVILQSTLNKFHDAAGISGGLKRFELEVTNTGLIRYRKTYSNNKIEFMALHISKIKEVLYLGNVQSGKLLFTTINDDVIVQTFNDKKGDIDSMANSLVIPLKSLDVDDINSICERVEAIKKGTTFKK